MSISKKTIIIVDDNAVNLTMCKNILKPHYDVHTAQSAANLFMLMDGIAPDLILLDVDMPELNGFETARVLKSSSDLGNVPFIFVSARRDPESEMKGLELGALDYIYKPFVGTLLLRRVKTHLSVIEHERELKMLGETMHKMAVAKTSRLWKLQNAVLGIIADLVECRDEVTGGHVSRTEKYLSCLIDKLFERGVYADDIADWDLDFALPSAQLHDIGKIGVSDVILNKAGALTPPEFEIIKTHVRIGVDAITRMEQTADDHSFFRHAKAFAAAHHEKWDGSGYPNGLSRLDIPLEGRLMALVDVYDALVSVRPYKKAFTFPEAEAVIREGSGTHFDPCLVDIFGMVKECFEAIVKGG